MNKRETIISLLKDYQRVAIEGVKCLNQKYAADPLFIHETFENGAFKQHGYLDEEFKISYQFHGTGGCIIEWDDGKSIDFELSLGGRCDGFDLWFVFNFYEENADINEKYKPVTEEDIRTVVLELHAERIIEYDELFRLYYFKKDLENPTPFRWDGAGHSDVKPDFLLRRDLPDEHYYFKMATDYIKENSQGKHVILPDSIENLPDFYCFMSVYEGYVKDGKLTVNIAGPGYTLINKYDERIFSYGSRHSLEEAIDDLKERLTMEAGIIMHFPYYGVAEKYAITITEIYKKDELINLFIKHQLSYINPQVYNDDIYRIAARYDKKILAERLEHLPSTFSGLGADDLYLFDDLINTKCCRFELSTPFYRKKASHAKDAIAEDYEPEW